MAILLPMVVMEVHLLLVILHQNGAPPPSLPPMEMPVAKRAKTNHPPYAYVLDVKNDPLTPSAAAGWRSSMRGSTDLEDLVGKTENAKIDPDDDSPRMVGRKVARRLMERRPILIMVEITTRTFTSILKAAATKEKKTTTKR
mmetsp:Transcript_7657/g.13490  ORF Transcript_7657/g.13490 Transcript_7657/m.13490 type:complete len:142 (+) Transcript_7657:464-889(+)